jgi:N-acetyl-gamma-glutamyl-phosphate reductase
MKNKIRIGILGATGYTALELIKLLLRHPHAEITVLTSRQEGTPSVASVHPQLAGRLNLPLEDLSPAQVAERTDCVFSCLPHGASAAAVAVLVEKGIRVVDFSADYRLKDAKVFAYWYKQEHHDAARLATAVYGAPELNRADIIPAQLVANPGCYPTSANLALAPLLKAGLIESTDIIIDSKSGVSGAGRTAKLDFHYPECNESFKAYGVGEHRHTPEIDQTLSIASGQEVQVIFTPHLVPMDRGILSTTYSRPKREITQQKVLEVLHDFHAKHPFVRVSDRLPATKDVAYTNFCDITARVVRGRVMTISCLDNLIKGASGQALQNFNLMYELPETLGLL